MAEVKSLPGSAKTPEGSLRVKEREPLVVVGKWPSSAFLDICTFIHIYKTQKQK